MNKLPERTDVKEDLAQEQTATEMVSERNGAATGGFGRGRFLGLALSLGAGVSLAACGSSGGSGEAEQPTASSETEAAEGSSGADSGGSGADTTGSSGSADSIVSASEVPVGESYGFENDGEPAILVHEAQDQFVAYSAVCTHQGCEVAYQNSEFVCPCHGSVFNVQDGAPTTGPAQSPLPSIAVEVQGGNVVRA